MHKLKTLATASLVAAVLVMGANYVAYAATGHAFILGKINKADNVTTLVRTTNGTALKLTTNNSSAAPLVTNGTGKVSHLNADMVDGKHAGAFAPAAHAPIAAGFINTDGSLGKAWGVASSTWDTGNTWYAITLQGTSFFYSSYAVNVTPTCANSEVKYDSVSGNLLVLIYNGISNARMQCAFAFTVYSLP